MMLNNAGRYVLSLDDWNYICKYFQLNSRTISIHENPQLTFVSYEVYDMRNNMVLFIFFDHDGMIRVPADNQKHAYSYEMHVNKILKRDAKNPPIDISMAISKKVYKPIQATAKKVTEKITGKENSKNVVKRNSQKLPSV